MKVYFYYVAFARGTLESRVYLNIFSCLIIYIVSQLLFSFTEYNIGSNGFLILLLALLFLLIADIIRKYFDNYINLAVKHFPEFQETIIFIT